MLFRSKRDWLRQKANNEGYSTRTTQLGKTEILNLSQKMVLAIVNDVHCISMSDIVLLQKNISKEKVTTIGAVSLIINMDKNMLIDEI